MLKSPHTNKSTNVRALQCDISGRTPHLANLLRFFDFTSWLEDISITYTEAELMADLHSGRGA